MIDRNFLYFLESRIIMNGSSQTKKTKQNKNKKISDLSKSPTVLVN